MGYNINGFLQYHPVFRLSEFENYVRARCTSGPRAAESSLLYYRRRGRVLGIRRGLYASVPLGVESDRYIPDPYLIASRLTSDALLVHHTALELHGKAYSHFHDFTYQTAYRSALARFRGMRFTPVRVPGRLLKMRHPGFGIMVVDRYGLDVRVATIERTLVDVFDNPHYCGSWEEIWRSLESVEFFDTDSVIEYVRLLGNAGTAARVGYFLRQNAERLQISETCLEKLRELRPKSVMYFDWKRTRGGRLDREWNLIINAEVLNRTWEEPHETVA